MDCYPKGGDPEADRVWVRGNKGFYDDSYFGILIREDVEAEVLAILDGLPLPMKAYADSNTYCYDNFDGSKTYADFKQWQSENEGWYLPSVTIAVPMDGTDESEKEEYANQIFEILVNDGFKGGIDVCFFPSEAFEKVTRRLSDFNELARQCNEEYALFSKNLI